MKSLHIQTMLFHKLVFSFREWLSILGYAEQTVYAMPTYINEFLFWLEKKEIITIENITPHHIINYHENLKKRKHTRADQGLSSAYLNKHIQGLRLFSRYLRETNQPSFQVSLANEKASVTPKEILTKKEVIQLFDTTADDKYGIRDRAMLSVYYGCGLRLKEGVRLDINDIITDQQLVYVRYGKNYTERYVPISKQMIEYINDYLKLARNEFVYTKEEAFFLSQRGNRISGQSLGVRLRKLLKDTESEHIANKNITMHSLRHSIATHLLQGGMRLERIAQFLGHKSIESTQIYTHILHDINNE